MKIFKVVSIIFLMSIGAGIYPEEKKQSKSKQNTEITIISKEIGSNEWLIKISNLWKQFKSLFKKTELPILSKSDKKVLDKMRSELAKLQTKHTKMKESHGKDKEDLKKDIEKLKKQITNNEEETIRRENSKLFEMNPSSHSATRTTSSDIDKAKKAETDRKEKLEKEAAKKASNKKSAETAKSEAQKKQVTLQRKTVEARKVQEARVAKAKARRAAVEPKENPFDMVK